MSARSAPRPFCSAKLSGLWRSLQLEIKQLKSGKKHPDDFNVGELKAIPIEDVQFPIKAYNAFIRSSDYRYVTDFIGKSEADILNVHGIGMGYLDEIKAALERYGIQLLPGKNKE